MSEEIKILHIIDLISNIDDGQVCIEPIVDTNLGFKMFAFVDGDGTPQKTLAKNQDAYIKDLRLIGSTTTGATGMLKHDTNGDITGGKITVDTFNNDILSDGPISGGAIDGSGTLNYLAKFTDTDEIGNSTIVHSSGLYLVNSQVTSHSLTDGIIVNQFEVNGPAHFDGAIASYYELKIMDDVPLLFGTSMLVKFCWDTTPTTNAHLLLGFAETSNTENVLAIGRSVDFSGGLDLGTHINPTLILKGAGSTAADRTELSHGLLESFASNLIIKTASQCDLVLEVDNVAIANAGSNTFDASAYSNLVIGHANNITNAANENVICGYDHTISSAYNNGCLIGGSAHTTAGTGNGFILCGLDNHVNGKFGITTGAHNENDEDYCDVKGYYAKALWPYASFFSSKALDGSTAGITQCFNDLMLCRATSATSAVILTRDGTGSSSPIVLDANTFVSFKLHVFGTYLSGTSGYRKKTYEVLVSRGNSMGISQTVMHNEGAGAKDFTIVLQVNDTDHSFEIEVTPNDTNPAYVVAYLSNGIITPGVTNIE